MHNHMQNKQRSCTLSRLHPVGNQLSQQFNQYQRNSRQKCCRLGRPESFQRHALHLFAFFCGATIMRFAATLKIHNYTFLEGTSVLQRRGSGGGGSLESRLHQAPFVNDFVITTRKFPVLGPVWLFVHLQGGSEPDLARRAGQTPLLLAVQHSAAVHAQGHIQCTPCTGTYPVFTQCTVPCHNAAALIPCDTLCRVQYAVAHTLRVLRCESLIIFRTKV